MTEHEIKICKVIKIIDQYRLVINKGKDDGISDSDRFIVYELGEELFDPDTNENLGQLEIVKGSGEPIHIQEKITTIESTRSNRVANRKIIKRRGGGGLLGLNLPSTEEIIEPGEQILEPFEDPKEGDLAKIIKKANN